MFLFFSIRRVGVIWKDWLQLYYETLTACMYFCLFILALKMDENKQYFQYMEWLKKC